tara:strand:+ start:245 stop:379 length:135 start_codon:yes stop_codon:yes gene_type:complete
MAKIDIRNLDKYQDDYPQKKKKFKKRKKFKDDEYLPKSRKKKHT